MALSAAEKQRRYRQKRDADPERRQKYLEREKKRNREALEMGLRKRVSDMTTREKRAARKRWREEKRARKERVKKIQQVLSNTPPPSPLHVEPSSSKSKKETAGQNVRARNRSRLYRKIEKLEKQLLQEKRRASMYKKRFDRLKKSTPTHPCNEDTCNQVSVH